MQSAACAARAHLPQPSSSRSDSASAPTRRCSTSSIASCFDRSHTSVIPPRFIVSGRAHRARRPAIGPHAVGGRAGRAARVCRRTSWRRDRLVREQVDSAAAVQAVRNGSVGLCRRQRGDSRGCRARQRRPRDACGACGSELGAPSGVTSRRPSGSPCADSGA